MPASTTAETTFPSLVHSLAQTDLEYEVTRVKSPVLGRDLNPMGRGDGAYYANGGNVMGGSVRVAMAKVPYVGKMSFGYGNSVNNQGLGGGGDRGGGGLCISRLRGFC